MSDEAKCPVCNHAKHVDDDELQYSEDTVCGEELFGGGEVCVCDQRDMEIATLTRRVEELEADNARLGMLNRRLVEAWEDRYQQLKSVHAAADRCIPIVSDVAKKHGYAIGVHGSLARDIDLIAAPWTDDASAPLALVEAICAAVGGYVRPDEESERLGHADRNPALRPHGRLAWSIWVAGGTYLDVSVMPLKEDGE